MDDVVELCAREHYARPHALDGGVPVPAAAEVGVLCGDCYKRLQWRLEDVPDLVLRARAAVVPDLGVSGSSEPISGSRETRLPFDSAALEAADALFRIVADWSLAIAETMGVKPPEQLAAVAEADGNVNGFHHRVSPETARDATFWIVRWLVGHLESVAYLPLAVELFRELVPAVERAYGRWGGSEPKVRQRSRPCPLCGETAVRVSWAGQWPVVSCRACLHELPVDWRVLS